MMILLIIITDTIHRLDLIKLMPTGNNYIWSSQKTAKQESRSQTEGVRPSTSTDNHVKGDHSIEASSSSKTIWKETKDSESHICADHVKLSNFVNFYMKSSRSD